MGGHETTAILERLRSATTAAEQAAALHSLKNDIVGHRQKKEAWVAAGVLEPVVKILTKCRSPGVQNGKGSQLQPSALGESEEEDSVKLQAIQALSTFANGVSSLSPRASWSSDRLPLSRKILTCYAPQEALRL